MPTRRIPHIRAVSVAACIAVLAVTAGALAAREAGGAIDPGTRANGMLVVQGDKREADGWLFDTICDPIVRSPGRRTRTCGQLPPLRRLFVGYGIYAPEKQIESAWRSLSWKLWIDGEQVSLGRFGHGDRWIQADGRNWFCASGRSSSWGPRDGTRSATERGAPRRNGHDLAVLARQDLGLASSGRPAPAPAPRSAAWPRPRNRRTDHCRAQRGIGRTARPEQVKYRRAMLAFVATAYGIVTALAALLQARQLLVRRRSCDISALLFAIYLGSTGCGSPRDSASEAHLSSRSTPLASSRSHSSSQ